jgi:hypothetical protein
MYISITGLRLKKPWFFLHFIWHAFRSHRQATKARGVIDVKVTSRNGTQHTLTAWESKKDMEMFKTSGAHKRAIQIFRRFFTGSTYGYESDTIPDWNDALKLLKTHGNSY